MTGQTPPAGAQPKPIEYQPLDPVSLEKGVLNFNNLGYKMSDDDMWQRFPGLMKTDKAETQRTSDALTKGLTPQEQAAFVRHGITKSLDAFGGAQGDIGDTGSASRNAVAVTVAKDTLQKQDADRTALSDDLARHPERPVGLDGATLARIMIGNTVGANISDRNAYLNAMGVSQSQNAQNAQNNAAILTAAGGVLSTYEKNRTQSQQPVYNYDGSAVQRAQPVYY